MPRALHVWSGWLIGKPSWNATHGDGRPATQVRGLVAATSRADLRRKLVAAGEMNVSAGFVRDYWSDLDDRHELALLTFEHPDALMLLTGLSPGGRIAGQYLAGVFPGGVLRPVEPLLSAASLVQLSQAQYRDWLRNPWVRALSDDQFEQMYGTALDALSVDRLPSGVSRIGGAS